MRIASGLSSAVIVGAAPLTSRTLLQRLKRSLRRADVLKVAIDGGLAIFEQLGVKPDLYVGDLDSVRRVDEDLPAVFLPHEKTYSDLKATLEICAEMGVQSIEAWAVTGGRADHHWASLDEMGVFLSASKKRMIEVFGDDGAFLWVTPSTPLQLKMGRGDLLSIFNWRQASGVRTQGLAYPVAGGVFQSGSHGLSNYARSSRVSVSVRRGVALVIVPSSP